MLVSTLVLSALLSLRLSDENRFISVLFHLKLLNIGVLLRYVFFVM